jgi:adenylosuccinate synthase
MCTHYRLGDEVLDELPTDPVDIEQATPIMEYFAGWTEDLRAARSLDELPEAARTYLRAIEETVGIPLCLVSVGPERSHTIDLRSMFE